MAIFTGPAGPFGWVFQEYKFSAAGANLASFNFVNPAHFTTNTVAHRLTYWHLVPETDDVELYLKLSVDAGSAWVGGTVYASEVEVDLGGTITYDTHAGTAQFYVAGEATAGDGLDNTATTGGCAGQVTITGLSQGTDVGHLWGEGSYPQAAGAATAHTQCTGIFETVAAHNGLQLITNSGGIDGHVMLEGLVVPEETSV